MFSLQTIFGKGDRFYGLLEAAADAAVQSAGALSKLVVDHGAAATLTEFKLARQREKEISAQISQELVDTFVTALEREDPRPSRSSLTGTSSPATPWRRSISARARRCWRKPRSWWRR
jgi:hypothetical protein